jgi:hypothetical protein
VDWDLASTLGKLLKERFSNAPTFLIRIVSFKQRTHSVRPSRRRILVSLVESKRPAELKIESIMDRELAGCEIITIMSHQSIS